jgi:hypothetical protein
MFSPLDPPPGACEHLAGFKRKGGAIDNARQVACGRHVAVLMLLLLLTIASGCRTECRSLCTAWYDYQRDVCGMVDEDDERIRCIADYRADIVTDEELVECAERQVEVEDIGRLDPPDNACLCDGDSADCPQAAGDDDDSATNGDAR